MNLVVSVSPLENEAVVCPGRGERERSKISEQREAGRRHLSGRDRALSQEPW